MVDGNEEGVAGKDERGARKDGIVNGGEELGR